MQHLDGSGKPVLYIGHRVLKGKWYLFCAQLFKLQLQIYLFGITKIYQPQKFHTQVLLFLYFICNTS
jgi:hypothetical protein